MKVASDGLALGGGITSAAVTDLLLRLHSGDLAVANETAEILRRALGPEAAAQLSRALAGPEKGGLISRAADALQLQELRKKEDKVYVEEFGGALRIYAHGHPNDGKTPIDTTNSRRLAQVHLTDTGVQLKLWRPIPDAQRQGGEELYAFARNWGGLVRKMKRLAAEWNVTLQVEPTHQIHQYFAKFVK